MEEHHEGSVIGSPEHKIPACSVPKATHAEDDYVTEVQSRRSGVLAEDRLEKVIFEPLI